MQLSVQRNTDVPIYRQIVHQVRDQIRTGALLPGSRLPPVRELATQCGLTRLTVHSAYAELQVQGLVESYVGRGTFVSAGDPAAPQLERRTRPAPWVSQGILANLLQQSEHRDLISLIQAFPAPETYPVHDLGRAMQRVLGKEGSLGYGHIQGELPLREQMASLLLERGLAVPPEHILITAGAQQGIDLVLRALTDPGDAIMVEEPVYPGVLELAAQRGQPVIGIANSNGTLRIDALEAACAAHQPRLLYLVPAFNNPTGRSLSAESRQAVLRLANTHNFLIIEDDTYGFLGFDRPAPPALMAADGNDRVLYITSFSKMLAPALRLGALVAPVSMLPALAAAKQSSDLVCSALMQLALAEYLRAGHLATHLSRARSLYQQRRDTMLAALQRHMTGCTWSSPEGGLSLWVELPASISERDFTTDALERGVGIAPGTLFFAEPRQRGAMRLSFGMHAPERIEEGIQSLGALLALHLSRGHTASSLSSGAAGPLV